MTDAAEPAPGRRAGDPTATHGNEAPSPPAVAGSAGPSGLAVWLGVADNAFTRQKTVKFGDASAVNSGRLYSILVVLALLLAWWVAGRFGLVAPIFWPSLSAVGERAAILAQEGFRNVPAVGAHLDQRLPRAPGRGC